MKILAIIPARGGSKGIPRKNIKELNGLPLIAYTIKAALNSNIDRVIISTDDLEIKEVSEKYGAEVILRPSTLALDTTPTLPVLQDIVSQLEESYDAVMTLQPTSPFRTSEHINEAIQLFESDMNADSLVSVVEVPHSMTPCSLMTLESSYMDNWTQDENKIFRRQEKPTLYARNGAAIYITRTNNLENYIFGGKTLPYIMNKIESIDIDDLEDFKLCEMIFSYNS
jgi:CMP-N-acetylneuraminic acid synthetase